MVAIFGSACSGSSQWNDVAATTRSKDDGTSSASSKADTTTSRPAADPHPCGELCGDGRTGFDGDDTSARVQEPFRRLSRSGPDLDDATGRPEVASIAEDVVHPIGIVGASRPQ